MIRHVTIRDVKNVVSQSAEDDPDRDRAHDAEDDMQAERSQSVLDDTEAKRSQRAKEDMSMSRRISDNGTP